MTQKQLFFDSFQTTIETWYEAALMQVASRKGECSSDSSEDCDCVVCFDDVRTRDGASPS